MCCCGLQWPVVQLEGSIKSAQTLFARYDMDLDLRLRQQDYYDLMLELNLALPYQDYQRFIDGTFTYAGMYAWPANSVPSSTQPRVVEQVLSCACHHDGGVFLGHSDDLPLYCPRTALVLADADLDGCLTIEDFIPLYKSIAAVRRAFRRQDHHSNGQIDRYLEGNCSTCTVVPIVLSCCPFWAG